MLPIPSKSPRIRIASQKKEKEKHQKITEPERANEKTKKIKRKAQHIPGETRFFSKVKKDEKELNQLDLQAIPKEEGPSIISIESTGAKNAQVVDLEKVEFSDIPTVRSLESTSADSKLLREIEPTPYKGSLIADKEVYGPPRSKSKKGSKAKSKPLITIQSNSSEVKAQQEEFDIKRERLEEDMTEVLSILSQKLKLPEDVKPKSKSAKKKEAKSKIPPANMNEILSQLLNVDLHIEASAILQRDKILASAISSRITDSLLATIAQNLSMIGTDIIEGLSAGKLKSISVRGTEGILDLAHLDINTPSLAGMLLIIFSHPKVKSGIINFVVDIVKKQTKEFLGISK